jgi:8-oxo-dGTP pyrophosphatase MutT (NUDIX family)
LLREGGRLDPYGGSADDPQPRDGGWLAAVALILRGSDPPELLFIERAKRERDPWSGHMAFPGGRRDVGDASLYETAVRETREETGIDLARDGEPLGRLSVVEPQSPRLPPLSVLPFVFAVAATTTVTDPSHEVSRALWVPLRHFDDESVHVSHHLPVEGAVLVFPGFRVEEGIVWGLTRRILEDFLARLR